MSAIAISSATFSNGPSIKESVDTFIAKLLKDRQDKDYIIRAHNIASLATEDARKKTDIIFGTADRITWKLDVEEHTVNFEDCPHYGDVAFVLNRNNYYIKDYIEGTCTKLSDFDRIFKIGRVLTKLDAPKSTINGFANSAIRAGKTKKLAITLSRNVYDILTMSTFRGWRSCMSVDGSNFYYIGADLTCGTLIAYVHEETDTNIEKPSGRVLLKPVFAPINDFKEFILLYAREHNVYGTISDKMNEHISDITKAINKQILDGANIKGFISGIISDTVYKDSVSTHQTFFNNDSDINFDTYDFKGMSSSEIKGIINGYYAESWEGLVNPHLLEHIYYGEIANRIASEDDDTICDILKYLNKNPDNDKVQDYLYRIYHYLDYSSEKRCLTRNLAKFDNLVANLSEKIIDYIHGEYITHELDEKLKELNHNYRIYYLGRNSTDGYIATGILDNRTNWDNFPNFYRMSDLAKEVSYQASKLEYGPIFLIEYNGVEKDWSKVYDKMTLRDKVFAYNAIKMSSSSAHLLEKILASVNEEFGVELNCSKLSLVATNYTQSYKLIGFNKKFNLPIMIEDKVFNFPE